MRGDNIIARAVAYCLNEAIGGGFSFGRLKSIRSFRDRVRYCQQCLGRPIGRGTARLVFQLDDQWVLKLAMNGKGVAQNEQEGHSDWYRDQYGLFPDINYDLSDMEGYLFIVSEYVIPAQEGDFQECLGVGSEEFFDFLTKCHEDHEGNRCRWHSAKMSDERFSELIENEDFDKWYNYMGDYQIPINDLYVHNFGMVQRGGYPEIVMLDNGLNDDIYKKYYDPARKKRGWYDY